MSLLTMYVGGGKQQWPVPRNPGATVEPSPSRLARIIRVPKVEYEVKMDLNTSSRVYGTLCYPSRTAGHYSPEPV